jgi:TPR repeat protein
VAEALASDRKAWLEREQTRTEGLTRQLVAAHEQIGELKSKVDALEFGQSPPEQAPVGFQLKEVNLTRLLEKANQLIGPGDVSGARLLLERAVESGSPEAAFYLAQTYDPRVLSSWKVQGIGPDPDKARALYSRAHEAGLIRAKEMADMLR